jgi:hypothetical protein
MTNGGEYGNMGTSKKDSPLFVQSRRWVASSPEAVVDWTGPLPHLIDAALACCLATPGIIKKIYRRSEWDLSKGTSHNTHRY